MSCMLPDWEIKILTDNPKDPNYLLKYLTREELPDTIFEIK